MAAKTRPSMFRWDLLTGSHQPLWRKLTPSQLFVGSFLLLILIGTLGLRLLPGLHRGEALSWLDSLFTSTSAVCVTGLIVVDTAEQFTFWGQAWILLLIQLGGLGVITFTSLIILLLGGRLTLRQEALVVGSDAPPVVKPSGLLLDVVRFTLVFELCGAAALYVLFLPHEGLTGALWPALFHSVSAFCNAGFSTFSDSLMSYQEHPAVLAVIMILVVAGGLGFLTLEELKLLWSAHRRRVHFRFSLHSRLVLVSTAALLAGGWLVFTWLEWENTFADMGIGHRLVNGLFLSATPRTAGFNTIDYGQACDSTNFVTILLMSIGGSPGSTAGGMKTTTFALVGLLALTRFLGNQVACLWGRSVRQETMARAVGLYVVSFTVVTVGILVLTWTEPAGRESFLDHMFEAVSAFNTVGLSIGVTGQLSDHGRWTCIVLMFLGRIGTMTFAAALALHQPDEGRRFRYSYEEIVIG